MTRVGAIDCGTNSIRLLIADVGAGGLEEVHREMRIVRLGHGVDATGRIGAEPMARTLTAAADYAAQCEQAGCESVRFVATSASRDAANADEFVSGVTEVFAAFGTSPEVITGREEAELSFAGATTGLTGGLAPYLVVDIGGGSTEFVRGDGAVEQSASVDIGCVRMAERHLRSDPPSEAEIWPALGDITMAVNSAAEDVDLTGVGTLVGVAGSVTTVTAHALRLDSYDSARIHGAEIPVDQAITACTELAQMSRADRAALPYMHEGRVDVIGAGALVWRSIIQRVQHDSGLSTVRASEHDILDGIALSQARPA
ncbi:Ppx/GppA family phosphatase [Ornithinimicrobium sp. F0845]|uniref:Ppx/GppA phosphatase family protein n=1 Tax=Ornithinimicrobium sp. F0845 TaxID=2926412 RepID=UPI001FF1F482|nr:Ppx/GppA phosphatase family protein [Ornithinimicrobium sp. F0845]MCK0113848.1 Ppx/GppA family phosphatase [Ornithinimicrobium sp. F0845]